MNKLPVYPTGVYDQFAKSISAEDARACTLEGTRRVEAKRMPDPDPARASPTVAALIVKYEGLPEQGTDAWLESRKNKITASNVARVVGEDKYYSTKRYFEERAGIRAIQPFSDFSRAMMDFGSQNEERVLAKYQRDPRYGAGTKSIFSFGLCGHPVHEWLAGSPDGITEDGILLEVKCPVKRKIIPGQVPQNYVGQVQTLMEIFDLEVAHFIEWQRDVATGKEQFNVTVVPRDRQWFAGALVKMEDFWHRVQEAKNAIDARAAE